MIPLPLSRYCILSQQHVLHIQHILILIVLLFFLMATTSTVESYSYAKSGAKERFENVFFKKCPKYEFYNRYISQFKDRGERDREQDYIIFVFHDPSSSTGGLGDRLAGLLTSFAFSVRTGRRLLVQGDEAMETLFRPFHPSDATSPPTTTSSSSSSSTTTAAAALTSWKEWGWSGWQREFVANMTYHSKCVNPKSHNTFCALDNNINRKVLKIRSNRCYLCRWAVRENLGLSNELLGILAFRTFIESARFIIFSIPWYLLFVH